MLNGKEIAAKALPAGGALIGFGTLAVGVALAASVVVVTPANTQGWSTSDTRPGGNVSYVLDADAPGGHGALQLTTDLTTTAKAQYMHAANEPLANVSDLSYYTKQVASLFAQGDPSYQLVVFLNGGTSGFTTLVYEPYQNTAQGTVTPDVWQKWDVANGLFWSSRTVTCSNGVVNGSAGGPATYTLAQISSICPDAVVAGFGVNIGSNNPGYTVLTDLVDFNGTAYDFESPNVPTSKEQCKGGGYASYTDESANAFPNQGQCVKYVELSTNNGHN